MSKYDRMIALNRKSSEEKVDKAVKAIHKMLEDGEKVTIPKLMNRTGLSRGFFYKNPTVLWSSIFVTLMANKIGGLQFGIYRNCQISSRVFHTAVAALPLTKANRSDFE